MNPHISIAQDLTGVMKRMAAGGGTGFQPGNDAVIVIVADVFVNHLFQMVQGLEGELLVVIHFCLHSTEEVFRRRIVQTVSFTAHALRHAMLAQELLIIQHLVLPALVGVEDRAAQMISVGANQAVQHTFDLVEAGTLGQIIGQDLTGMKVNDGREIQLPILRDELGDIRTQLFVGL